MSTQHISNTRLTIPGAMKMITLILLLTSIFIIKPAHGLGAISDWNDFYSYSAGIDTTNSSNAHFTPENLNENVVEIPDIAFLYALIDVGVDTNGDSLISYEEAEEVSTLVINGYEWPFNDPVSRGIKDLNGIEAFVNLDTLLCNINDIGNLDLSANTGLKFLDCSSNRITDLDITKNLMLEKLIINDNQLSSIDVSENSQLLGIYCGNNQITELVITNNPELTVLDISDCPIQELDFSNNVYLKTFIGSGTQISQLEISDFSELEDVEWIGGNLTSLVITNSQSLKDLYCHNNQIVNFSLTSCPSLISLNCGGNQITHLDVSAFPLLENLWCWENQLTQLDISECPYLENLNCRSNHITQFDVSQNPNLVDIVCFNNDLTQLDVSNHSFLAFLLCGGNPMTNLDLTNCPELRGLDCSSNNLIRLNLSRSNKIGIWEDRIYGSGGAEGRLGAIFPALDLTFNPSLGEVCTWAEFHPDSIDMDVSGSPNVYFTTECGVNFVSIPDTAFLRALIDEGVDTNGDSLISYGEAESIISLDIQHNGIQDLTGINAFRNLDTLICIEPNLKALDISNLGSLLFLETGVSGQPIGAGCGFTSLDLSNNTELEVYNGHSNLDLTNLNISKNTQLKYLDVGCNFSLENLEVSNNTQLLALDCHLTIIKSLDVSNNTALTELVINSIETLHKVCVWEGFSKTIADTSYSPNVYFTTECGVNYVSIPDTAFLHALIDEDVDSNGDGLISYSEAEAVTELDIGGESYSNRGNISDMSGIEAFINLDSLNCSLNELTGLDVSNNTALAFLDCRSNRLTSMDISNNTVLTSLECWGNRLTSLDVSNNTALDSLYCSSNQLSNLDISNNTALIYLDLRHNQMASLDVSNNTALSYLNLQYNQITSLDVSNNTTLTYLNLWENRLTSLDVSNNAALESLNCALNLLASLDVSNNTALTSLNCGGNRLISLDVSNNIDLTSLGCWTNQLTSLDVSNNIALKELICGENQLTSLDVFNNVALIELNCGSNQLNSLDVSNNIALIDLNCSENPLTSLDISNNTALESLNSALNLLTSLDVSNNVALIELNCRENSLTSLDVSENTSLTALDCSNNQLTGLDVTTNVKLSGTYHPYGGFSPGLYCSDNLLTSLDISKNTDLYAFDCHNDQLSSLDISSNINLRMIDLSGMTSLGEVCVWESFAADSSADSERDMEIITTGSTGICFQTNCNGACSERIVLSVSVDTIYQPINLEATSSADGMIYLVPVDTDIDINVIRGACMDSVEVVMNTPVNILLEGLENGTYWLYATDTSENISEPKVFTIMGVGLDKSDTRSLRIYPNPANTLLTIETITTDLMNVKITSINGQIMLDRQMEGIFHQLDLSYFPKGVYFITVRSTDFVTKKKIIKL